MKPAGIQHWGRLAYLPAWERQKQLVQKRLEGRIPDTLVFVEHDPVLTLGSNFHEENLLLSVEDYRRRGIEVVRTDRGGDVTYHGPNQLVVYPIFDLREHGRDLHLYLRNLEEAVIRTLAAFGLEGYRFPPNTGVWVNQRKIAAIGIKVTRWISLHGIALNCNNDLSPFSLIVPCGIREYPVTSLSKELGREVPMEEVFAPMTEAFQQVFGLSFTVSGEQGGHPGQR
ncbi:MAG: octanoyltransferase [Fimbriimonadales bacterium]|nr:MAG: octanoyltransferase [Fimbriimonadales bacterium]